MVNDSIATNAKNVMFWGNVFSTKYDLVIAICDEELIDKEIGKNPRVKISKNFYGGLLISEQHALKMMKKATIGNIMGKKIVELAEKSGFITKENIILIDGVPHAQFVKI
jgi:hypothetical protein